MKNHFLISESEKNRILGLHESHKTSHGTSLLNEQEDPLSPTVENGRQKTFVVPQGKKIELYGFKDDDIKLTDTKGTRATYVITDSGKVPSGLKSKTMIAKLFKPKFEETEDSIIIKSGPFISKELGTFGNISDEFGKDDVVQKIALTKPKDVDVEINF